MGQNQNEDAVQAHTRAALSVVPKPHRGETNKPMIPPQVGNSWVAHQALGLPSPDALAKKFTRARNPWPAEFRTRDNGQWLYNIGAIREWLFRQTSD